MNRLIVAGMLVLAGAFSACAAEVTPDMARTAMGNWRRSHGTFGMRMGKTVSEVRTVEKKGIRFHVVKMSDGGAILVPATTKKRPVVMLLEGDDFDESDENPLWDILVPDLGPAEEPARKLLKAAAAPVQKTKAEQQWDELLAEPLEFATEVSPGWIMDTKIDDVRVDSFVKTYWNQGSETFNSTEYLCWNRFTPKCPDGNGAMKPTPSGCVATALAQIVRHFEYPSAKTYMAPYTNPSCASNGVTVALTTLSSYYDWSLMPNRPEYDLSTDAEIRESQLDAIGKFVYDIGVYLGMSYRVTGSASNTSKAPGVLLNRLGYSNATYRNGLSSDASGEALKRIFVSNFDARLPVQIGVGIMNHSIVGDGYGYNGDDVIWYHLNYGWGLYRRAWYQMPEYDRTDLEEIFESAVYNIYTTRPANQVIVSGRVTRPDGTPLAGATVSAAAASAPETEVTSATTDANGIYAVFVEKGEYVLSTSTTGSDSIKLSGKSGAVATDAIGNVPFCDIALESESLEAQLKDLRDGSGNILTPSNNQEAKRSADGRFGLWNTSKSKWDQDLTSTGSYRLAYNENGTTLEAQDGTLAAGDLSGHTTLMKVTKGELKAGDITSFGIPLKVSSGTLSFADGAAKAVTVSAALTLRGGATLKLDATAAGCDTIAAGSVVFENASSGLPVVLDIADAGADWTKPLTVFTSGIAAQDGIVDFVRVTRNGQRGYVALAQDGALIVLPAEGLITQGAALDYLQSSRSNQSSVDTGYYAQPTTCIDLDFQLTAYNAEQRIFGMYGDADDCMTMLLYTWSSDGNYRTRMGKHGTAANSNSGVKQDTNRHIHTLDGWNGKYYIDGEEKTAQGRNLPDGTLPANKTLWFFFPQGGANNDYPVMKLYGSQFYEWENDQKVLKHDWAPWRTYDGKIGLCDLATMTFKEQAGNALAWRLAYMQDGTTLKLHDGTLAAEHLTTDYMKRFDAIAAVEKVTAGEVAAGAVTAYAMPLTVAEGVFSLADGAAKAVTVDGALTLKGGTTLKLDATAAGCDSIAATAVAFDGATAEKPVTIDIADAGADWSEDKVLLTGVAPGADKLIRLTENGAASALVAAVKDGSLVVAEAGAFVTTETASGYDFTNGTVRVTGVPDGATARLTVKDFKTGSTIATFDAKTATGGVAGWDLADKLGALTPGGLYAYEVDVTVDDQPLATRTGLFMAANWNVLFGAKVEGGAETVTGGAWTAKPPVGDAAYLVAGSAAFGVTSPVAGRYKQVDTKVTFDSLTPVADLAGEDGAFGGFTAVEDSDGAAKWAVLTAGTPAWTALAGATPVPGVAYVVRAEIDLLSETKSIRYSVSSDGGASFASLSRVSDGETWIPLAEEKNKLETVAVEGMVDLGGFEATAADKALAEVGGVRYDTLAEAMAAAGERDITLLTNVKIVPTRTGSWSFLKGGFDALVDLSKLKKATYRWEGGVLKVTSAKGMIIMFLQ